MVIRFPDYPFPVLVVGSVCKLQLAGEVFQDLCGSLQKLRDGLKSLREVLEKGRGLLEEVRGLLQTVRGLLQEVRGLLPRVREVCFGTPACVSAINSHCCFSGSFPND